MECVRRRVFCNRMSGLRLDTVWWEEDAELLVLLSKKRGHLYMRIRPTLLPEATSFSCLYTAGE